MAKNTGITKPFVLSLIFVFCLCLVLYISKEILAPFIVSAFLAYLISPVVDKIMLLGLKRWVSVSIVVIVLLAITSFIISVVVPIVMEDINSLINKIPEYKVVLHNFIASQEQYFDKIVPFLKKYNIMETLMEKGTGFLSTEATKVPKLIVGIVSAISIVCFVPVLTFFMLLRYDRLHESILQIVPSKYVDFVISIFHEIDCILGGYIRGQIIEVCFIAVCSIIALSVLNIHYAFLIGVIAGLCNLIPYLGPAIGFVLGIAVAGFQYHAIVPMVEVAISFLVIQQLDNNIVQPVVIGHSVNLSPVMMMFALLAGANAFGVIGMFLAVPVLALLKNILILIMNRYKQIY